MNNFSIPSFIGNWINGYDTLANSKQMFEKLNPATGSVLYQVAKSDRVDVELAVEVALDAQPQWANVTPVARGGILRDLAYGIEQNKEEIASVVALETGKSMKEAIGETIGAAALGHFFAGEGQRFYARTTTSGVLNKFAMTIRQPVGVAGLIVAANTPIANIAWKVFPALLCGNATVLKPAEDTPATAWLFSRIAANAGLPNGVLNIIHGLGREAGAAIVEHSGIDVVSFTGSTQVGRWIATTAGQRLAKVSLELGGKNPLIVCDDADLNKAVDWVVLSAFSNAGQRCASCSRVIVFDSVYEVFREKLIKKTKMLKVGNLNDDDLGPVINLTQLNNMLSVIDRALQNEAKIILGGHRLTDPAHVKGFYMAPTIIENVDAHSELSVTELFGPILSLYKALDFNHALAMADDSPYGLTACIHTRNVNRAIYFSQKIKCGVAVINGGTYGSEPHMPFGGLKNSGNGWREPGTEALDVYSELKDIYMIVDPEDI